MVRGRKWKPLSGVFKIHVIHMIAWTWLQIWKLDGKLYNMNASVAIMFLG